ncbi:Gmad2 immunoglobulin-like domain-containing protein [Priestia abyssalis]|uniref:Gmad2 immunoglobulin-like domain-containing protein n=1 Tax=Priestia abyssalis TaxID=1221450 RepID=UPI000994FD4B|nr:Gmad2 immunoglobulin-like domain-containing protein [Priestia abyssalis]
MQKKWFMSMGLLAVITLTSGCQQGDETVAKPASEDQHQTNSETKDPADHNEQEETKTVENEAFKISAPIPNQTIHEDFTLKGTARVFEATFHYKLEDDQHNILAEGFITADKGAPEWGDFEVKISFKETTSTNAMLTIFEESAKDGSPQHELFIPLIIEKNK